MAAKGIERLNTKGFQLLPKDLPGSPKKVIALKTLQEREEELEFTIDAAELASWNIYPSTNTFIANNRLKEWYGFNNEDKKFIERVFSTDKECDKILIQNEVNELEFIIEKAHQNNRKVILNPSPFTDNLLSLPLAKINMLILNEIECQQMGHSEDLSLALKNILKTTPNIEILLTKGKDEK